MFHSIHPTENINTKDQFFCACPTIVTRYWSCCVSDLLHTGDKQIFTELTIVLLLHKNVAKGKFCSHEFETWRLLHSKSWMSLIQRVVISNSFFCLLFLLKPSNLLNFFLPKFLPFRYILCSILFNFYHFKIIKRRCEFMSIFCYNTVKMLFKFRNSVSKEIA